MKNRSSTPVEVLNALVSPDRPRSCAVGAFGSSRLRRRERIQQRRDDGAGTPRQVFLPRERLAEVAHLAGVEEADDAHLAGDREHVLGVEQQALVAAEHDGDPGTVGPIERMSKPRTLYSPPRNRRSKIGSDVRAARPARCTRPARAGRTRSATGVAHEQDAFDPRLVELRVAAQHRQVDRRRQPLAGVREDRVVHGVVDEARHDLADRAACRPGRAAASRRRTGCGAASRPASASAATGRPATR